jgi:hypothetical protein
LSDGVFVDVSDGAPPRGLSFRLDAPRLRWWWSADLYRLHGYEPGSVVPNLDLLLEHTSERDRDRVERAFAAAHERGRPFVERSTLRPARGGVVDVALAGAVERTQQGEVTAVLGVVVPEHEPRRATAAITVLAYLQDQTVHLREAMRGRELIGRAKGMIQLMARCDEDTAWAVLVRVSQTTNRKVVDVAAELVHTLPGQRPMTPALWQALRMARDTARKAATDRSPDPRH